MEQVSDVTHIGTNILGDFQSQVILQMRRWWLKKKVVYLYEDCLFDLQLFRKNAEPQITSIHMWLSDR